MKYHYSGHSVYLTQYHVVWITKYRRRILKPGLRKYLVKLFPKILKTMPGVEIKEHNIQSDHLHLVILIPPKYPVSSVVGQLKSQTASQLRKKFPWLKKVYWKENIVWSSGYCVATFGLNEVAVLNYVRWRQNQDSGQAKLVL
jgi:putative transposase